MDIEDVKKLIKENLEVKVVTEGGRSECSYYESTYVELIFMNEVISRDEIQNLSVNG